MLRIAAVLAVGVVLGSVAAPPAAAAQTPPRTLAGNASTARGQGFVAPYNLVIVNLDASISFQIPSKEIGAEGRVLSAEALTVVQQLFRDSANQRRRRTDGVDRYVIVAVDAASQVIWRGTRDELRQISPDVLQSMLRPRQQFAGCTDIGAAFDTDLAEIRRDAHATSTYVLTFSDLVNEPPTTSWRKCAGRSGEPPSVNWKDFRSAALGFYFVSTDFKLRPATRWSAALEREGLHPVFLDAAQTMSQQIELAPPVQATYQPSTVEVQQANESLARIRSGITSAVSRAAIAIVVIISVLMVWVVIAARRRRPRAA